MNFTLIFGALDSIFECGATYKPFVFSFLLLLIAMPMPSQSEL